MAINTYQSKIFILKSFGLNRRKKSNKYVYNYFVLKKMVKNYGVSRIITKVKKNNKVYTITLNKEIY